MENGDKIFFQKKIIYLDYMERENKVKNGGVIKWEARGDESRIQIHIRGLYPTDSCKGELKLLSQGEAYPADVVYLQYGTAEYAGIWHNTDLAGTGIPYEECDGIIIRLSETRFLRGIWRKREKTKDEKPMEPAEVQSDEGGMMTAQTAPDAYEGTALEPQFVPDSENIAEYMQPETESVEDNPVRPEEGVEDNSVQMEEDMDDNPVWPEADMEDSPAQPETDSPILIESPGETIKESSQPESVMQDAAFLHAQRKMQIGHISPNKWEQLNRIYPRIQPFGDVREYLSITPADFVIMSENYQEMVQNSFLLHGYYNYGHLILTKIKEGIADNYYLGVPGVYYEREKQAALLFGFEGFEGDGDAVQDGSFGYYMKRVEI